jgi:NhaA family Na+:H+ antiporter
VFAVVVLGIFYTPYLDLTQLYLCSIPLLMLALLNMNQASNRWFYYIAGFLLWLFTVKSGIHGTIAGIIIAFFIPKTVNIDGQNTNFLKSIEASIHSFVAFYVLPLFAFVNCELPFNQLSVNDFLSTIAIGSFVGLFVGKTIGVFLFTMLAVKFNLGNLPEGVNARVFLGLSFLCGIGFTLSLFIGIKAFVPTELENQMKIGVLSASFLSAIVGAIIIHKSLINK